jgi:hypothetical protein
LLKDKRLKHTAHKATNTRPRTPINGVKATANAALARMSVLAFTRQLSGQQSGRTPTMTNPNHTDTSRSGDLVASMKDQLESWEFEDPRETWWKWQHQYAQAADRIEALEAALRIITRETTAVSPDVLNQQMCIDAVNRHAIAALGDGL